MKTRNLWRWIAPLMLIITGCVSTPHKAKMEITDLISQPQPGKALIIFLRSSHSYSDSLATQLFDDERYIGTSRPETLISYQAQPGKHLFIAMVDKVNFLSADLQAGKTYYVLVTFRGDAISQQFGLIPQNGDIDERKINAMLKHFQAMAPTLAGLEYGETLQQEVEAKKAEFLPLYEQRGDKKIVLKKESGV